MIKNQFSIYLDQIRATHAQPLFIPRQMITREDWERASGEEYGGLHGGFRDVDLDLAGVLEHSRVVFVGEPGMGKTSLARAALLHFAEIRVFPIFVSLSDYAGDVDQLLRLAAPQEAIAAAHIDGQPIKRAYVLDGLDEVAAELVPKFLSELGGLLSQEPEASYVLTCRQALYEGLRARVPSSFQEFFPLGFNLDDIIHYATKRGLNPDQFSTELNQADLWDEASIPFVLEILVEVLLKGNKLEATRGDNLAVVVDSLLAKRSQMGATRQRRALQLLGLAMELHGRNELRMDDAARILSERLMIDANEAGKVIDELTHTILVRTALGNVRFQMRSFGEYLAARQLEHVGIPQILSYARFRKTLVLNPTWGNTISYLVEMHPRVRAYFVRNEPEWVLPASLAALTKAQRHEAACLIVDNLARSGRYLLRDVSVNHYRLARLLTSTDVAWLRVQFEVQETVRRANAVLLLGHLKDAGSMKQAVTIALDQTTEVALRRAAFVAIGLGGSPDLIPTLLAGIDAKDPLVAMCLDALGSVMTPETLPQVLPALIEATTSLPNASLSTAEIHTREMLVAILDYFLADPNAVCDRRVTSYVQPVWKLLNKYSDEVVLARIGMLLANCERRRIWDQQINFRSDLLKRLNGRDPLGVVSRTVLQIILKENLTFRFTAFAVSHLCTAETARWLVKQKPPDELVREVASRANEDVREILRPASGGLVDAQDEARQQFQQEENERRAHEAAERKQILETIRTQVDIDRVVTAFAKSTASQWPELSEDRKVWLGANVSRLLVQADVLHRVQWLSESQVRFPSILPVASDLAGRYGLPLDDDVVLVDILLALDPSFLIEYHRKRPLSATAVSEIERMLADPALPVGAVSHFMGFVETTRLESPAIFDSLRRIAGTAKQTDTNRNRAANVLSQSKCPIEVLLAASKEATDSQIAAILLDALTDRQHLPTIFERLNHLPTGDHQLRAFEQPFPETTELDWIGKIRAAKAWSMLAQLRHRLLRLALPRLVGVVESALAAIDRARLIDLMSEQLKGTPENWREYTKHRMAEHERELRFEQAASISIEEVLTRLADASSAYRVKLLCEGPTDMPVHKSLLDCRGLSTVVIQSVNGWANVLSPHFDIEPYLQGFQYVVLVLDGDNGRDLSLANRPIKPEIQQVIEKLELVGVPVRVLMRYGIESYFSQTALQEVLGRALNGFPPLDETRPLSEQIGGYNKNLNVEVIKRMTATDFDGTDLAEIFDELCKRVKENT